MRKAHVFGLFAILACAGPLGSVSAQTTMSVEQQNALVQKHCAVCHNDAARNGGLTLQRFDGATVAPSLAAMMLSKLTGGLPLQTVALAASSDSSAKAQLSQQLQSGAIMAAGVAPPDRDTTQMLAFMFAAQAKDSTAWHMVKPTNSGPEASLASASVLREVRRRPDMAESYRLVISCDTASLERSIQLAWSPEPRLGAFTTTVDGRAQGSYRVEGKERMGNGVGASAGLAAHFIPLVSLPSSTLTVHDLFPGEAVEFWFGDLSTTARQSLSPCFTGR